MCFLSPGKTGEFASFSESVRLPRDSRQGLRRGHIPGSFRALRPREPRAGGRGGRPGEQARRSPAGGGQEGRRAVLCS